MKKKSRKGSYVTPAVGLLFLGLLLGGIFYMKNQGSGKSDDLTPWKSRKRERKKAAKRKKARKKSQRNKEKKPQRLGHGNFNPLMLGSVFPAEQRARTETMADGKDCREYDV